MARIADEKKGLSAPCQKPLVSKSTRGGTRTLTRLLSLDFESSASANSATLAKWLRQGVYDILPSLSIAVASHHSLAAGYLITSDRVHHAIQSTRTT